VVAERPPEAVEELLETKEEVSETADDTDPDTVDALEGCGQPQDDIGEDIAGSVAELLAVTEADVKTLDKVEMLEDGEELIKEVDRRQTGSVHLRVLVSVLVMIEVESTDRTEVLVPDVMV